MKTPALVLLFCSTALLGQYYPHDKSIDYNENYRGQYHFSPRSEWMNDINGLVYQGRKYHMIYQWGKKIRHGVYSYSEQFAFTPERDDIELLTDGDVKLVSLELHELNRIW